MVRIRTASSDFDTGAGNVSDGKRCISVRPAKMESDGGCYRNFCLFCNVFGRAGRTRKTADRAIAWFLIVFSNIRLLMEMQGREHIGWIDLLRVVACFLVVLSHCCDPFVARFDADRGAFLTGVFTGSFVRACVPLFVMMTGCCCFPYARSSGIFTGSVSDASSFRWFSGRSCCRCRISFT